MSSNLWRDSDPSDEETTNHATTRKRSSRACDQCRKTKSKCERSPADSDLCKNCAMSGNVCTFLGPSYKRGPPKGYIHAIEQRWQTIESLLGALIGCPDPAVQDVLCRLRQDDLAREILNRVDAGPFGPSGRLSQPDGATKEDMLAQIFKSNEYMSSRDAARLRRQSRISREVVSSGQDNDPMAVPTKEWQDRISSQLASSSHGPIPSSNHQSRFAPHSSSFDMSGPPVPQRRRMDDPSTVDRAQFHPNWNDMYTMGPPSDSDDNNGSSDAAEAVGQLSLDENSEIRYHGKSSGLHLLGRSDRKDDRNEGGIWRLPMARVWPRAASCSQYFLQEESVHVNLPPIEEQERLLNLYFNYVHPVFPVVHKTYFMAQFNASKNGPPKAESPPDDASWSSTPTPPRTDPAHQVPRVLLLSMLAIAARYTTKNVEAPPPKGQMWEGGCSYLNDARELLNKIIHQSRPSTCQALLVLGHREFGIGSMEQGWLYIGSAIRMAQDLGLNRNADKWQYRGNDLFTPQEKQMRKQLWFACVMADEYSAVYMGRSVTIGENDFDTLLPNIDQHEEDEPWSPANCDPMQIGHVPVPGRIMSCFRAAASLCLIVGSIVTQIYPVKDPGRSSRAKSLADLESRLDQWYIDLPDCLRCDTTSKRIVPPPHILFLHIKYWGAVLLLHRAFLPNWKGTPHNPSTELHTASLKAFDLCQTAASHVSALATVYHDNFNLRRSSPFLSSYLLNAGVTHVVTLTLRPLNQQASLGLRQCLTALKKMEMIWPSAGRAWALLEGAKVQFDNAAPMTQQADDRRKRHADDAFGQEKNSDVLSREAFGEVDQEPPASPGVQGIQDMSTRIMAHMLGLDIPGIEPSTSYYPGYEWWPRTASSSQALTPTATNSPGVCNEPSMFETQPNLEDWLQGAGQGGYMTSGHMPFDFSSLPTNFGL